MVNQGLSDATRQKKAQTAGAFDGLRLLAACTVLFSHGFVLLGRDMDEPLVRLTRGGTGLAEVAVYAFFAISGYLITQSWMRDPSLVRFMIKRLLRLIPALLFVIVGSFAIVGPFVTTLSLADYFSRREAWEYLTKILIYPAPLGLPGVFENNPFPHAVNGNLWSLRVEFTLYVVIAVLGYIGALRWRCVNSGLALLCLIASIVLIQTNLFHHAPFFHQAVAFFPNAVTFFVGGALAERKFDAKIIMLAVFLSLATGLLVFTPAFKPLLLLALPMVILLIARYGTCDLSRIGDFSYGLYLWSFVMQQTVISFMPHVGPFQLFLIAGSAALGFAIVSWHVIEKRALALKPKRQGSNCAKTF